MRPTVSPVGGMVSRNNIQDDPGPGSGPVLLV
jgi:hypothetical protein